MRFLKKIFARASEVESLDVHELNEVAMRPPAVPLSAEVLVPFPPGIRPPVELFADAFRKSNASVAVEVQNDAVFVRPTELLPRHKGVELPPPVFTIDFDVQPFDRAELEATVANKLHRIPQSVALDTVLGRVRITEASPHSPNLLRLAVFTYVWSLIVRGSRGPAIHLPFSGRVLDTSAKVPSDPVEKLEQLINYEVVEHPDGAQLVSRGLAAFAPFEIQVPVELMRGSKRGAVAALSDVFSGIVDTPAQEPLTAPRGWTWTPVESSAPSPFRVYALKGR